MKATIYDLGRGIGVALLSEPGRFYVAEVNMDGPRVLPQTIRRVESRTTTRLTVDDTPTAQDHVDRAAMQISRMRSRLRDFDDSLLLTADGNELREQARQAIHELRRLVE